MSCSTSPRAGTTSFVGRSPSKLCAVALWLAVALNASRSRGVWDLLYFWGLGAAASYVFANTDGANYDTFHFYQYFIVHGYILLTMVLVRGGPWLRGTLRHPAQGDRSPLPHHDRASVFRFRLFRPAPELQFHVSYQPPDVPTPLDGFGHGWGYYFAFIALCAAVMAAAWLPWGIAAVFRGRSAGPREGRTARG